MFPIKLSRVLLTCAVHAQYNHWCVSHCCILLLLPSTKMAEEIELVISELTDRG